MAIRGRMRGGVRPFGNGDLPGGNTDWIGGGMVDNDDTHIIPKVEGNHGGTTTYSYVGIDGAWGQEPVGTKSSPGSHRERTTQAGGGTDWDLSVGGVVSDRAGRDRTWRAVRRRQRIFATAFSIFVAVSTIPILYVVQHEVLVELGLKPLSLGTYAWTSMVILGCAWCLAQANDIRKGRK